MTNENRTPVPPVAGPAKAGLSRRALFVGGAATAAVLAGCRGQPDGQQDGGGERPSTTGSSEPGPAPTPGATTGPSACTLTPEVTSGPYHLDGHLARPDITEGRPGRPLTFRVRVLARPECGPLTGAAVDIWHCDAGGEYSGFNGNSLDSTRAGGTNDERFLRGVQLTGRDGVARFTTIFPGWYEGRTVHIHLKVFTEGALADTYAGGHVAHVGQAFFDEAETARTLASNPYLAHRGTRTTNAADSIYSRAGSGSVTRLVRRDPADPRAGHIGELTCIVDPEATPPEAPLF